MAKRGMNRTRSRKSSRRYYYATWAPGGVYHVYNHAVMPNLLFGDGEDRHFFVMLLREKVIHFAEVFAYALIPNHFHIALRIKSEAALRALLADPEYNPTAYERKWLAGEATFTKMIGDHWANIFAMYTAHRNPKAKRRGTLLDQTVRRIRVRDDLVSRRLIMYIHTNEVKHHIRNDYEGSSYLICSYAYYFKDRSDHWLARDTVLERFGGLDSFVRKHREYVKKYGTQISAFDEEIYFEAPGQPALETPYVEFLEDAPPW